MLAQCPGVGSDLYASTPLQSNLYAPNHVQLESNLQKLFSLGRRT
jgi:hypothetical protein